MTNGIALVFLVAGAVICLIAAIGVMRLPDFFMRLHAATKAGVAGAGLVLIGVGFAEPSLGMWIKIAVAITFLLMTTPVAGHLLGRAGYVAGVQLWGGTTEDQLRGILPRGVFDWPWEAQGRGFVPPKSSGRPGSLSAAATPGASQGIMRITVCLASGPGMQATIDHAVTLAEAHHAKLLGLAIVDTKCLSSPGALPLGSIYYTSQQRLALLEKARSALAEVVKQFERAADAAGIAYSVRVEEGNAARLLARSAQGPRHLLLVSRHAWFDHGVLEKERDTLGHLVCRGVYPLVGNSGPVGDVRNVVFVHDGSRYSDRTWDWLLDLDPWPDAAISLIHDDHVGRDVLIEARSIALRKGRRFEEPAPRPLPLAKAHCQVVVFGNEGHVGWIGQAKAMDRIPTGDVPIVVFG